MNITQVGYRNLNLIRMLNESDQVYQTQTIQ